MNRVVSIQNKFNSCNTMHISSLYLYVQEFKEKIFLNCYHIMKAHCVSRFQFHGSFGGNIHQNISCQFRGRVLLFFFECVWNSYKVSSCFQNYPLFSAN